MPGHFAQHSGFTRKQRESILYLGHLFRGDTREKIDKRFEECGYYCGRWETVEGERIPVTSFSLSPLSAMDYSLNLSRYGRIVLVAIDTGKYIDSMRPGLEVWEIEVLGGISKEDIIEVDCPEKLKSLYRIDDPVVERYYNSVFS